MLNKTRCIVLKTVKYGDNSLIVDLLTRECGRKSVVWRMPKGGRGKIRRQHFQPLTILELTYDQRNATSLPIVKDVRILEPYTSIPFDQVKLAVVFFVAEFLAMATRAEQQDVHLYDFLEQSLLWYDTTDKATANFHLMLMMRISLFLGFYPDLDSYEEGAFFDLRAGNFCIGAPCHKDFLRPAEARNMLLMMRMTPANMHVFRFSQSERNTAIEFMLHFYALHIPGFKEPHSWEILKELFRPAN